MFESLCQLCHEQKPLSIKKVLFNILLLRYLQMLLKKLELSYYKIEIGCMCGIVIFRLPHSYFPSTSSTVSTYVRTYQFCCRIFYGSSWNFRILITENRRSRRSRILPSLILPCHLSHNHFQHQTPLGIHIETQVQEQESFILALIIRLVSCSEAVTITSDLHSKTVPLKATWHGKYKRGHINDELL